MTSPAIHASIHAKASRRSLAKSMQQQEAASIQAKASRRSLIKSMHQQKTRIGPSGGFQMQHGKIDA